MIRRKSGENEKKTDLQGNDGAEIRELVREVVALGEGRRAYARTRSRRHRNGQRVLPWPLPRRREPEIGQNGITF